MKRLLSISFFLLQSHCFLSSAGQAVIIRNCKDFTPPSMLLLPAAGSAFNFAGGWVSGGLLFEQINNGSMTVYKVGGHEQIPLDKDPISFLERSGYSGSVHCGAHYYDILFRTSAGRMAIKIPKEGSGVGRVDIESPEED